MQNGVFTLLVSALFCAIGTALWTYYRSNPEMLDPALPKADSILPFFIVSGLPEPVAGLAAAALSVWGKCVPLPAGCGSM